MLQLLIILEVILGERLRRKINLVHIDWSAHTHIEILGVIPESRLKHPRHVPAERRLIENAQCT